MDLCKAVNIVSKLDGSSLQIRRTKDDEYRFVVTSGADDGSVGEVLTGSASSFNNCNEAIKGLCDVIGEAVSVLRESVEHDYELPSCISIDMIDEADAIWEVLRRLSVHEP